MKCEMVSSDSSGCGWVEREVRVLSSGRKMAVSIRVEPGATGTTHGECWRRFEYEAGMRWFLVPVPGVAYVIRLPLPSCEMFLSLKSNEDMYRWKGLLEATVA